MQVITLIEGAEKTEQRRKEEKLLHYAREGKAEEVTRLVSPTIVKCSIIFIDVIISHSSPRHFIHTADIPVVYTYFITVRRYIS